jgi:hypothetical protein
MWLHVAAEQHGAQREHQSGRATASSNSGKAIRGAQPKRCFMRCCRSWIDVPKATAMRPSRLVVLLVVLLAAPAAAQTPGAEPNASSALVPAGEPANLRIGDLVRPLSGGPAMRVRAVEGDQAICDSVNGLRRNVRYAVADLAVIGRHGRARRWQTEPKTYRPCPASVILKNGRHACLG